MHISGPSRVNRRRGTSPKQNAAPCWSSSLNKTNSDKKWAMQRWWICYFSFPDLCFYSSPWEMSQFNKWGNLYTRLAAADSLRLKDGALKSDFPSWTRLPAGKRCAWFIVPRRSFISTPTPQTLPAPFASERDDYDWTNPTADGCYQSLTYFFSTPWTEAYRQKKKKKKRKKWHICIMYQ